MATPTYTKAGAKATTTAKLDKAVFDVDVKSHSLIKQAYVAYQANGRENLAKTLKRGEVRGGGKKPWKQKGTGRARFGSIRVPIWRGGGITFGPLGKENYSRKLTLKSKRQAIRQALTLNAANISVVESVDFKGKTTDAAAFFSKINAQRSILLVVDKKDELITRSVKNLGNVTVVSAMYLNVYAIMNADSIVIEAKALDAIHGWLGNSKEDK